MASHVVHLLDRPEPFQIDFFPEFSKGDVESDVEIRFVGVSPGVDAKRWPMDDRGCPEGDPWSKPDVFVVSRGGRGWAFGDEGEVVAFLGEQDAPVPEGLQEALADDRARNRRTHDGKRRHWEPDLLNAETYTVYTAICRAVGEGCDYDPWGGIDDAIGNATPAYYSGSASVQIGSLPVWRTSASGGVVNPLTDDLIGQERKVWEHPALAALKERESALVSAPTFG